MISVGVEGTQAFISTQPNGSGLVFKHSIHYIINQTHRFINLFKSTLIGGAIHQIDAVSVAAKPHAAIFGLQDTIDFFNFS